MRQRHFLWAACTAGYVQCVTATEPTEPLETIIVTGSLIPQLQTETITPVTVITAEDIKARGFSSVADALQQSSFATGSVQGDQFTNGFTPGAQTLSMFGLDPGYVKYLIDGRPMSDYPALYNASSMITNLSGIPTELVDHIDILPGGQSSLYGSDAIAGVVNVVMKKQLTAPVADVRYEFYGDGGGETERIALAGSFRVGDVNLLAGVQYENSNPIWGYQRDLTAQYFTAGSTPQTAERDYLVYGLNGIATGDYYFLDPSNCAHVTGQFGGSIRKYSRPEHGLYCGTTRSGYYSLKHGGDSVQVYLHGTADVGNRSQLYADVLWNHEVTTFNNGTQGWGTGSKYGYYYDPNLGDLMNLQHLFSPEETGGMYAIMSDVTTNAYRATLGGQGPVGSAGWTYDMDGTHTEERLSQRPHDLLAAAVENFFAPILGPSLGLDPILGYYPIFTPNYAAFYTPVTPAQYASFSGNVHSRSTTSDNLFRAQLTNASLFHMAGGPAGMALAVEGGDQDWETLPKPGYFDGQFYNFVAVTGSGHRTRYAVTTEFRLPVIEKVTLTASGRYDLYRVAGSNVDKATYNLGIEFRPRESLLLRGRYGTAFKAPTLADEFQGKSGYGGNVTDYYQCTLGGYTGINLGNCPYYLTFYLGSTAGNPKLKPITANVANIGVVWAPVAHLSFTIDYLHWAISNETNVQSADTVMQTESRCRLGTVDINSPTCKAALSQVTRDAFGQLVSVYTPKINVSNETVNAFVVAADATMDLGQAGRLAIDASWNDMDKHTYQQYPSDPTIDLLRDPTQSTEFKSKGNVSVTWSKVDWGSTIYVARYGRTPNNLASIYGYGTTGAGVLSEWTVCNFTARYQPSPTMVLSLAVNNAFNVMPPADGSYPGTTNFPFNDGNYNVYGRSYYLELNYQLDK